MSEITDRIADVLRREIPHIGIAGDAIASVLVDELGLREVRCHGTLIGDMLQITYDGTASAHRHYLTPWERVE